MKDLFILTSLVTIPFSIFFALRLNKKDSLKDFSFPGYRWGYYIGFQNLLALFAQFIIMFVSGSNFNGLLYFYNLAIFFVGLMIIRKNRWAIVIGTILSLNPLIWIINYEYIKSRWNTVLKPVEVNLKVSPTKNYSNPASKKNELPFYKSPSFLSWFLLLFYLSWGDYRFGLFGGIEYNDHFMVLAFVYLSYSLILAKISKKIDEKHKNKLPVHLIPTFHASIIVLVLVLFSFSTSNFLFVKKILTVVAICILQTIFNINKEDVHNKRSFFSANSEY